MHGAVSLAALSYTESAPFDCHWQCTECGFQVPPPVPELAETVYREPAAEGPQDRVPPRPCASCGASAWANLREGGVVEALIVRDEERQSTRGARRTGLIKLIGLSIWTVAVLILALGTDGLILLPLALGTALLLLNSAYREFVSGRRERHANSWSHPVPPRGRVRARVEGVVEGRALLRAPLTGRACLAYELGVRHDSEVDADPWSWTLLEQRSAGLHVGGTELSAPPYLILERQVHPDELDAAARDELRKRGLDPTRPGYTLFESILEAGEWVCVETRRSGLVLRA